MGEFTSIHVPAQTVRRVARWAGRLALWVLPSAATVWGVLVFGVRWVGDLATMSQVSDRVADVRVAAKAAQDNAFAVEQRARSLQQQSEAAWVELVRIRAELEVSRRFPGVTIKRHGDLVDDAQRFYVRYFEAELRAHPNQPHLAAKRTFELYRWTPPS